MGPSIARAAVIVALAVLAPSAALAAHEPVLVRDFEQFERARSPLFGMARGCGTLLLRVWVVPPTPGSPPISGDAALWKSDGTAGGTEAVFDTTGMPRECMGGRLYYPGSNTLLRTQPVPESESVVFGWQTAFRSMHKVGGLLLLMGSDDGDKGREPWRSDGSTAGTMLLKDIRPEGGHSDPLPLGAVGRRFYFSAMGGLTRHGRELWVTDGTRRGTRLVKDILPGRRSSFFGFPDDGAVASMGRSLFFAVDERTVGMELWRTDGTSRGTRLVKDIRSGPRGSDPRSLVNVHGVLYFTADDGVSGRELWRTDGTRRGTRRVRDIRPGAEGSMPRDLVELRGRVLFTATDGASGREVWSSDGTAATTRRLRDIRPGPRGSGPGEALRVGGGRGAVLYFVANDGRRGRELWGTDGSAVRQVADIRPGKPGADPYGLTRIGRTLYFGATDGTAAGSGLWRYDKPGEGI